MIVHGPKGDVAVGGGAPLLIIAGPCVIESSELLSDLAPALRDGAADLGLGYVFKASYDKANRTSITSFRGPGLSEGLAMLSEVRRRFGAPVISDVHSPKQAEAAAEVLDILQIPAFLCRQTDLLVAAAKTGKPINIKKGQFLSPWDMGPVIDKVVSAGNEKIMITERGASFGYRNLVVDMRGFSVMRGFGVPVIFDATHSVQQPGGLGDATGGDSAFAPPLARAAVAAGVDGVFMEVHPDPEKALCDGPNSLPLSEYHGLIAKLAAIDSLVGRAKDEI